MPNASYIEIILTNKGKLWILVEDFRFRKEKATKTTWNIKSFIDGNLTIIMDLMMRDPFRDAN